MKENELHSETPSTLLQQLLSCEENVCVEQVLGKSAFETTQLVYLLAEGSVKHGPYVRKLINKQIGLGSAYIELYKAQQKGLVNPALPRIFALQESDVLLTVLMEYVEGKTLAEIVTSCSGYAERLELARHYFPEICSAVSALHTSFNPPIIHRDLKPSNIMVCPSGIKLLDFGIARVFKQEAESDTKHFGTRPYAPPEQYGFGQTDVRSDVYALGKVLCFCLTGEEPASDVSNALAQSPETSDALQEVVIHATKLDPLARPQSAEALKAEFEKAAQETSTAAKEPFKLLGIIWDILLVICAILVLAGAWQAFTNPTPENQTLPSWYLFYSLFFWAGADALVMFYLVSDRRPIRKLIPSLAKRSIKQELIWGFIFIAITCTLWMVITLVAIPHS